jgi:cbb3-type cytochrome oxidase subunit 3
MQASAQFNGIIGPLVYQPKFGPDYTESFSASIGLVSTAVVFICITWYIIAKRDRAERDKPAEAVIAGAALEFREGGADGKP